jgi:DMSO/TMAO reductase YedYZ molybdopterin-dependent catalytic subunit
LKRENSMKESEGKKLRRLPIFQEKKTVFKGLSLIHDESKRETVTLSLEELERSPSVKLTEDFKCLEGWKVEGVRWEGIPLSSVTARMNLSSKVRWFVIGAGNFTCLISRKRASRGSTILASKMDGRKLNSSHGGPFRLVFQGQKCYESIKSVDRIIAIEKPRKTTAERIAVSRIEEK